VRNKLVVCEVFFREVCHLAANSPSVCDVTFMPFGLHSTPDSLRVRLQQEIDAADPAVHEHVILAYGLCSGGTSQLRAGSIPVVIPKAHDCITLFLGSRVRYDQEFSGHPGTYYYTPGWIERADGEVDQGHIVELKERERTRRFDEYKEKYGEDNAIFLIEQETLWLANYNRAAFINTNIGDLKTYRSFTERVAASHGWTNEEIPADLSLMAKLFGDSWDEKEFLVVPPGWSTAQSFDEQVVKAIPPAT
jgi:hypothetical protein